LIGNGVGLQPLGKTVQSDQKVSASLVAPREGLRYINGYPSKQGPKEVLMHLTLIPVSGTITGSTGVTLLAPLPSIVSCLEAAVHLPDLIQSLGDTQVTS
jgi:hypothetical protein